MHRQNGQNHLTKTTSHNDSIPAKTNRDAQPSRRFVLAFAVAAIAVTLSRAWDRGDLAVLSIATGSSSRRERKDSSSSSSTVGRGSKPIAVCIAGQVRSFVHRHARLQMYHRMIAPIRRHADVYLALSADSTAKRRFADFATLGSDDRQSLEVDVREMFEPAGISWEADNAYKARELERLRRLGGGCQSNREDKALPQSVMLKECSKMMAAHRNGTYEFGLRLRPDGIYGGTIPPLEEWPNVSRTTLKWEGSGQRGGGRDHEGVVFTNYLGGCGSKVPDVNGRTCMNDEIYVLLGGTAVKAAFDGHYDSIMNCTVGRVAVAGCPECIFGAIFSNFHVEKRRWPLGLDIYRRDDELGAALRDVDDFAASCIRGIEDKSKCDQFCSVNLTQGNKHYCQMMLTSAYAPKVEMERVGVL